MSTIPRSNGKRPAFQEALPAGTLFTMRGDGSGMLVLTTTIIALMLATLPLAFRSPWLVLVFALVGAGCILAATIIARRTAGGTLTTALLLGQSAVAVAVIVSLVWVGLS